MRRALLGLCVAFIGLNGLAYGHARTMTHFLKSGKRTGAPNTLSLMQKLKVVTMGVELPRPLNDRTPADQGMPFDTWTIPVDGQIALEAWVVGLPDRKGTVILFHGYADRKASVLPEARAFFDAGWDPILVDMRGSGGSTGDTTSIGYYEGADVAAAFGYVRERRPKERVVVWGVSMGAAAALRAVGALGAKPDGLILEAPFATLRSAVVNRFHSLGLPAAGVADLLVFWGGEQQGFDGFRHNPLDYARTVRVPTLLMQGSLDDRVLLPEGRAIFEALGGEKAFEVFDGLGHQSLLRGHREQWISRVPTFLTSIAQRHSS